MSFTRIPNKVIDDLSLNPYQFQLFSIVVRKTDGWCKTEDGISISQFQKLVTFSKPKIVSTLKELEEKGIIEKEKQYNEKTKQHSFSRYKIHRGVVNEVNKGSKRDLQGVVNEVNKQKKLTTKETNTKPTLEEIQAYIQEKKLNVDGAYFYQFFSEGDWKDSNGKAVKSWKQKLLTWNRFAKKDKPINTPLDTYEEVKAW